ncbi:MAG: amino acid permease [Rhodospirillaceae bacterium]|jgi:basic amino acid/polyamine antiporter, APA family|nr:amino acid permease [Rhodospirillaceae bacterium]MBT4589533.1 amino acid permease [Rhodospirillaceae bacterium]MBT5938445.1 amino acid permease [Rhodospirillaceae bacterium]MBT7265666.1 amino acid permease [Rhodospirillaceae bacterium]
MDNPNNSSSPTPELRRSLNLPLIVLYGLGTTIGGGIYVLVGRIAARAGMLAPLSFVGAALLISFTALTYAELSSRYPRCAGQAIYVEKGFGRKDLATLVGLLVILNGVVSSAALSDGFVGYFQTLLPVPTWLAIIGVTIVLGLLASWGISESVILASVITVIEVGGLLIIIWVGRDEFSTLAARSHELVPTFESSVWIGILSGSFLAFYAFIGFEDMVNVAEEIKNVEKTLPVAIILTLIITGLVYVAVSLVAVLSVAPQTLGESTAPLSLIYETKTKEDATLISIISIFAVLNGALIQIIMAARVLYGMSRNNMMPDGLKFLGDVHPRTQTPIKATFAIILLICILALGFSIEILAETTSLIILVIACLVNGALLRLKLTAPAHQTSAGLVVPIWIPALGMIVSFSFAAMVLVDLVKPFGG